MGRVFTACASRILDLIYPPALYCICCGKIIDDTRTYSLCNDCMEAVKWIDGRTCRKCGKQLSTNNPQDVCFGCMEHEHFFDRGYTCTEYGAHERNIIFSLKYDGRTDIAPIIGEILFDRMIAEYDMDKLAEAYDAVISVPIHKSKLKIRGFNQAELIAREFSSRAGLPYDDSILERVKETHIMRALGPDERKANIQGAFRVHETRNTEAKDGKNENEYNDRIAGKSFLVVDDIYTTGATIDEISFILKAAGAARVDFITLSSGADMLKADSSRDEMGDL